VGPPLWGVAGRRVASVEGYDYSAALKAIGGTWKPAKLDLFLINPKAFAPGTRMDMGEFATRRSAPKSSNSSHRLGQARRSTPVAVTDCGDRMTETTSELEVAE
jgi:hypothetical protein